MNIQKLKQFLIQANQAGYASTAPKIIQEADNSKTIIYENGDWKMHDNFFGGEPYGGREVISYREKPYFLMAYYGNVDKNVENLNDVYNILRAALREMPKDYPYRGPKEYKNGDYTYTNNWIGEINEFSGEEHIYYKNKKVYGAKYMGGLVDQRNSSEV